METRVRIPSQYLDDMLLESFLNDEYEELQEAIQENIFGCSLENNAAYSKGTLEVKTNLPLQSETGANPSNDKYTSIEPEKINPSSNSLRKRKVEKLEEKEVKQTESSHVEFIHGTKNKFCDSIKATLDNSQGNRIKSEKYNFADHKETVISNEVKSNGSILQNGPTEFTESENEVHGRSDENVQLQPHSPFICIEKQNNLFCKNIFLLTIKVCLVVLFSFLLYYFILHKQ